ncbi:TMED6 [Branchiostoma lanceolatum]|uniref:TMED6 protein n=1 Tax=Branchiostoma lanceolatum TaxID=7740 RepID=A0A8J9W3J0_BRALA|nr:TMED6 [Branchiostoma lanceolatum]
MIAIVATNPEVEDKLTELNEDLPENKQVSFHVAIEIPARYAECFYQYVGEQAKLHVDFKVLRGYNTDQDIVMKVFDPNGDEFAERVGNSGEAERDLGGGLEMHGTYKICFYNLDNIFKRLVDLSVRVTSVDWFEYKEHLPEDTLEDLDKTHITESLDRLHYIVNYVQLETTRKRLRLTVDSLQAESSFSYVDHLGLLSCLAIIGSGLLQVYFMRKLFRTPNVQNTTNKA